MSKHIGKRVKQQRKPLMVRHPIDGVLVIDKPLGLSSNAALQRVKYLLRAKKAGHTGALDPLASGVLPLCFGEATKFSQYLLDADKVYDSDFVLGVATDSGDVDGQILAQHDASHLTEIAVAACLDRFRGPIEQIPPMHSALKHQGQALYKLARQGIEVSRRPRQVSIHELRVIAFEAGPTACLRISVRCSKGTYIRALARDIGEALGVGGHVSRLHRTAAGPFSAEQMHSVEAIESQIAAIEPYDAAAAQALLLPVDAGIQHLPAVEIGAEQAAELRQGRKISQPQQVRKGPVRVMLRAVFVGIAEADGCFLQPKRLVVPPA